MNSIDDFYSRALPERYHQKVISELGRLNEELHAFNFIN